MKKLREAKSPDGAVIARLVLAGALHRVETPEGRLLADGNLAACQEFLVRIEAGARSAAGAPPPDKDSPQHPDWHCQKHPDAEHERHPMGMTYCRGCSPRMWDRCRVCNAPEYRCCC